MVLKQILSSSLFEQPREPSNPPQSLRIVEFGSGSGNLILPLAWLMPACTFHAVDAKPEAISLLRDRAERAGLINLTASVERIEFYQGQSFTAFFFASLSIIIIISAVFA